MKKQTENNQKKVKKTALVVNAEIEEREKILQEGLSIIEAEERLEMVHFYSYLWTDPRMLGK